MKMEKMIIKQRNTLSVIFMLAALFSNLLYAQEKPENTQSASPISIELDKHSKIILTDDVSYAPFVFLDAEGNPRGITVDYWNLWSKKTGIEIDFRLMDWDKALETVREGDADAVSGLFCTPQREEYFDFTLPYFIIDTSIFFHKQIHGIRGLEDLKGFRIGVVKGDSGEEVVRKYYPDGQIEAYPGNDSLVKAAIDGKIMVFIADSYVARFYLAKLDNDKLFQETTAPIAANKQHAAVKKGNKQLLDIIQKGMDQISEKEKEAIIKEWTGSSTISGLPWVKIGIVFLIICVILILLLLWNIQLKKRVNQATAELQKRNEELQKSERNYREIFDASSDMIFIHDAETGVVLDMNQTAMDLCGFSKDDLAGKSVDIISDSLLEYSRSASMTKIREAVNSGKIIFEWRTKRKNGKVFPTEVALRSSQIGGQNRVLAVVRDITERKRSEEEQKLLEIQLQHSQKMESVGRLAGGIAHDFNNMLGVIIGHIDMIIGEIKPSDPLYDPLNDVLKVARRAAELTKQLLGFASRQTVTPKVLDLNDTVEGMMKIYRQLIGENIDLLWTPGTELNKVKIDPGQIDQILANLCVNSKDSINGLGRIAIETRNVNLKDYYRAEQSEIPPGEYVLLSVKDNGCGISKENLEHVFEPFFTTKKLGRGTGLGLATVYGIIKQNNGYINISSEPGKGTTVSIYLQKYTVPDMQQPE